MNEVWRQDRQGRYVGCYITPDVRDTTFDVGGCAAPPGTYWLWKCCTYPPGPDTRRWRLLTDIGLSWLASPRGHRWLTPVHYAGVPRATPLRRWLPSSRMFSCTRACSPAQSCVKQFHTSSFNAYRVVLQSRHLPPLTLSIRKIQGEA